MSKEVNEFCVTETLVPPLKKKQSEEQRVFQQKDMKKDFQARTKQLETFLLRVSKSRKVSMKIRDLNDIRRFPINITKLFQKLEAANSERQQYITRGRHDTRPGVEQSLQ